jgi:hypothetical protein
MWITVDGAVDEEAKRDVPQLVGIQQLEVADGAG